MGKEWYILIDGKKEGPFSFKDLKRDERITPDTLVWKKDFTEWVAIRFVPELKELFKDEHGATPIPGEESSVSPDIITDQETLTLQRDPSQMILWILILVLLIIYALYQFS